MMEGGDEGGSKGVSRARGNARVKRGWKRRVDQVQGCEQGLRSARAVRGREERLCRVWNGSRLEEPRDERH